MFVSFESSWKDQWIHGEAKLKTNSDFLKPIGGFTVSRVLRSQMIFAACFILCAAGSLFTSNSADSANVFAESNITLSNGVLPMISIIQYPYTNGGKPNYTISQFSLNSKLVADQIRVLYLWICPMIISAAKYAQFWMLYWKHPELETSKHFSSYFSWLRYFGICNCFGNISSLRFFAVHLLHGVVSSWCTWFVPSAGWYFGSYWSSLQCIVKRSTIIARRTSILTKAVGVGSYFVGIRQHGWTLGMDTITRGLIRNHARDTFSSTGCRCVSYCARVEPSPQLASSDRWKTC